MPKNLYLISHTHWDREWYQTFQQYRRRLVRFLDDMIDLMEQNEAYVTFHLDGQTVLLEDYLDIRPENDSRLKALVKANRLLIGPWYTMPDEFLISGEGLVRNLQKGYEISERWGVEPLKSGYVVDIFGHNSQFPQILKGFDINNAILFRGIADYPKDTFMWEGADGSQVITAKLDKNRAYSNFYFAIRWPFDSKEYDNDEIVNRMNELLKYCEREATSDTLLMMDGVDHIDCEPMLPTIVKKLEERIPEIKFHHVSVEDYFAQKLAEGGHDIVSGALYNIGKEGLNNKVLKNVLSSHVELKQENDRCERTLTAYSEPLDVATQLLRLDNPPKHRSMEPRKGYLDKAWEYVFKNQSHDSICGCSLGDVHKDNLYRFRQASQIADLITDDCLELLTYNTDTTGTGKSGAIYFYNPSQNEASGVKVFELPIPTGHHMNFRFYNESGELVPFQIISLRRSVTPLAKFRELITFPCYDIFTVAMPVLIPSCGYSVYTYDSLLTEFPGAGDYLYRKFEAPKRFLGTLRTGPNSFDTGAIAVTVNSNGTIDVTDKKTGSVYKGLLALEDTGDCGEGWNYVKPVMDEEFVTTTGTADFAILSDGPLAASFRIRHTLNIPNERDSNPALRRSDHYHKNVCELTVTIKKDSAEVEVKSKLHNISDDHRLRVIMPLSFTTDSFYAKTPFDMQKWTPDYEKFDEYYEVDTHVYPGQGIAYAASGEDGLSIFTRGLMEFELNKEASFMALTLMRAFPVEAFREIEDKTEFAHTFNGEFALSFGNTDEVSAAVRGEAWRNGIKAVHTACTEGRLPSSGSFVSVSGDAVLSSFTKAKNGGFNLRIYNVTDKECEGEITLPMDIAFAESVDFLNRPLEKLNFSGRTISYSLKKKQIQTIHFSVR